MSGVNIPSDSNHLSDFDRADMIEQYGGMVDSQFAKKSIMRKFVPVKSIRGTDTAIVRRAGRTTLQALTLRVYVLLLTLQTSAKQQSALTQ